MKVAITGGNLQGVETVYLAHKAGWETVLIDKRQDVPASGLCQRFIQLDLLDKKKTAEILKELEADLVIPAMENLEALESLTETCRSLSQPLAFDLNAFKISRSKIASQELFTKIGVPTPHPYGLASYPLIAKPDASSGSKGIKVFLDEASLRKAFPQFPPPDALIQEYTKGPSYSIEVIGKPGQYFPLQVTELEMDEVYDCKKVFAPAILNPLKSEVIENIAEDLAEAVGLEGIMDVEYIYHDNFFKVLEIDARIPSQTPTVVYHSCGINMLKMLADLFLGKEVPYLQESWENIKRRDKIRRARHGVLYQHIRVRQGLLEFRGEGIMADAGPLQLVKNFHGADEAITNYKPGMEQWVATLIMKDESLKMVHDKHDQVINDICSVHNLVSRI